MTDIALFPIPNCVVFPGTTFPLHIFEPRYRSMVTFCIENKAPIGVCHTQKVIHYAKPKQSLNEVLKSNQATYKPHEIFSAGQFEIVEKFDDGRLRVNVHMERRFKAKVVVQNLPFSIYDCEEYEDVEAERFRESDDLKFRILDQLKRLTKSMPELRKNLNDDHWVFMSPENFSFEIFGLIHLDSDWQQHILELRSCRERLKVLLECVTNVT